MITFPRLPAAAASAFTEKVLSGNPPAPAMDHVNQIYAPVGERARPTELRTVREAVLSQARSFGFPERATGVVAFDRAVAVPLRDAMPISGSEAGTRDMWTWIAFVLLPDVTSWRWASREKVNIERWRGRDLTRHTWARLWWQATMFKGHEDVLSLLQESELNQLFERREIGGRGALTVALAQELNLAAASTAVPRRDVFRDVNKRLLRALAYTDVTPLTDAEVSTFVRVQTRLSMDALEMEKREQGAARGSARIS